LIPDLAAISDLVIAGTPWLVAAVLFLADLAATVHIVLYKSDNRAALGWVGFVWFVPVFGSILYFVFGINRVRRKAKRLRRKSLLDSPANEPSDSDGGKPNEMRELVGRVSGPFVCRCLTSPNLPFLAPAHRTGQADKRLILIGTQATTFDWHLSSKTL